MADYVGDSFGDAARSEERAKNVALNLALANRDHITKQRQYDDALRQSEYQAGVGNYFKNRQLDAAQQTQEENLQAYYDNMDRLERDSEDRDKNEALKRETYKDVNLARIGGGQSAIAKKKQVVDYGNLYKAITGDKIRNVPELDLAVDGTDLEPEQIHTLYEVLGQRQKTHRDFLPEDAKQAAERANQSLGNNALYKNAKDDQMRALALDSIQKGMGRDRQKIVFNGKAFSPVNYRRPHDFTDAVDYFKDKPTSKTPVKTVPDSEEDDTGYETVQPEDMEGDGESASPAQWTPQLDPDQSTPGMFLPKIVTNEDFRNPFGALRQATKPGPRYPLPVYQRTKQLAVTGVPMQEAFDQAVAEFEHSGLAQ
jgi:hypothetical protein